MFRIWKYLPTFVFCTFMTIAQEPHHSLLSNGDQSEGIYITQIIRPQIWAQECTCTNRYIKMGPINPQLVNEINAHSMLILSALTQSNILTHSSPGAFPFPFPWYGLQCHNPLGSRWETLAIQSSSLPRMTCTGKNSILDAAVFKSMVPAC